MKAMNIRTFALLVGAFLALWAAPVLSQTPAAPLGPGFERLRAHLQGAASSPDLAVPVDLQDGSQVMARMCGTPAPTREYLNESRGLLSAVTQEKAGIETKAALSARIPLVFHVIQTASGRGFVPDEAIDDQVRVLNQRFSKLGVEFYVQGVNDVVKRGWFKKCLPFKKNNNLNRKYFKFTRRLAEDPTTTINVYTCQPHGNILGLAILPGWLPEDDTANAIVLHHQTLPGGLFVRHSQGGTGVHEMGHYLGLLHTFHPGTEEEPLGCDGDGDEVRDTPFEAEPAFECVPRDSCPQRGSDPITNFMDYTDDVCREKFTRGQRRRMEDMTLLYRPGLLGLE